MMLIKLLAPLLLAVATHGQSRCRLDDSCAPGLTIVELDICAFTDEDLDDLAACFDNVGRGNIEHLNLRRNDLDNIPPGFFEGFDALTDLDMDLNELTPQAGTFRGLTALDSLILTRNGITSLPSGFFEGMDSLRHLDLFRNNIELAAGDFMNATSLEVLLMRDTIAGSLPSGVFEGLDSLTTLDINENRLTALPFGVFDGLPDLQELVLSNNLIAALPDGIFGDLPSLRELNVRSNNFVNWTAGILDGSTSLTHLRLGDMRFLNLEAGTFDGTPNLEFLDFSFNSGAILPAGIFDPIAGSLKTLDISRSDLTTFPADNLADFVSLQTLDVSGNLLMLEAGYFDGPISLEDLTISITDGDFASDLFEGLASLRALSISGPVPTLPPGAFDDLTSLTSLSLYLQSLTTLEVGAFQALPTLQFLDISGSQLPTLSAGVFNGLSSLASLSLSLGLNRLEAGTFQALPTLKTLDLSFNDLTTLEEGIFEGTPSLEILNLRFNDMTTMPSNVLSDLGLLQELDLSFMDLTTVSANAFDGLVSLQTLLMNSNDLDNLSSDTFDDLVSLQILALDSNDLSTLPAGLFDGLNNLQELDLIRNDLQCLPATDAETVILPVLFDEDTPCGCPEDPVCAADGAVCECQPGASGYSCVGPSSEMIRAVTCPLAADCTSDEQCGDDEFCCPASQTCEPLLGESSSACGDPHMTGFRGQKFDFTGEDEGWYALISDLPSLHLNMRVTAPVPDVPEITYITGISLLTIGTDGVERSIAISVNSPHNMDSACPTGMPTCLADGALTVIIDGKDALASPGTAVAGPGVEVSAVNLPGACRSFGFEKYWERKRLEQVRVGQADGYELQNVAELVADASQAPASRAMGEWVLGDPTATNMMECAVYVAESMITDGGLFAHQSEHASFKISAPAATVRVSHGRLHQVPMRDPTDMYDLPDHVTWQMNLAVEHHEIGRTATGVLGETFAPTVDGSGHAIMNGMGAIRGTQETYRVAGPFATEFAGNTNRI